MDGPYHAKEWVMAAASNQSAIEAIVQLAEEIARFSPECASRAAQIVDLARAMESEPDEETVVHRDDDVRGVLDERAEVRLALALQLEVRGLGAVEREDELRGERADRVDRRQAH